MTIISQTATHALSSMHFQLSHRHKYCISQPDAACAAWLCSILRHTPV